MKKQLWILAGGNGSGKSTFYNHYLKPQGLSFLNADMIAKELSDNVTPKVSKEAQRQALEVFEQKLNNGETFCFETVFSHPSKLELIKKAKRLEYEVNLIFIHLNSTMLNEARVYQRVKTGGHNVPSAKIRSRVPRTLEHIADAVKHVDNLKILDNSSMSDPFSVVATVKNKKITQEINPMPEWAENILKRFK